MGHQQHKSAGRKEKTNTTQSTKIFWNTDSVPGNEVSPGVQG